MNKLCFTILQRHLAFLSGYKTQKFSNQKDKKFKSVLTCYNSHFQT